MGDLIQFPYKHEMTSLLAKKLMVLTSRRIFTCGVHLEGWTGLLIVNKSVAYGFMEHCSLEMLRN